MGIKILRLILAALVPFLVWLVKPISREARRQLRIERTELRERIRQCDEELVGLDIGEEARGEIEAMRDEYRYQLHYLETRVRVY